MTIGLFDFNVRASEELNGDEAKEIYALFGLAYYWANCLESGIVNTLCFIKFYDRNKMKISSRQEWEIVIDKHYDDSFAKTLGKLKQEIDKHSSEFSQLKEIVNDLDKCLTERNFLAHHFFREYAGHWFTPQGRTQMIKRLEDARELFWSTDHKLDAVAEPIMKRHGVTGEDIQRLVEELINEAGTPTSS